VQYSSHFKDTLTVGDPENAHHSSFFPDPAHHLKAEEAGTEVLLGDVEEAETALPRSHILTGFKAKTRLW
jgi:hypothetical protein